MKSDVTDDRDKFMRGVDRAEEMMPYWSRCSKPIQWMEGYVIFSSSGCPKQFRIVKKMYHRLKSQGKDHAVNGFMLHRVQTMTVSV